jgi:hypothetical protein
LITVNIGSPRGAGVHPAGLAGSDILVLPGTDWCFENTLLPEHNDDSYEEDGCDDGEVIDHPNDDDEVVTLFP